MCIYLYFLLLKTQLSLTLHDFINICCPNSSLKMKLLIVEDNPSVRRIIKSFAAQYADEILECENGEESFLLYCNQRPDFVLMDINLGETDGIEATRKITQFDSQAKVIIVTNYDEADLRQLANEAGAIGFVPKENLNLLNTILKN